MICRRSDRNAGLPARTLCVIAFSICFFLWSGCEGERSPPKDSDKELKVSSSRAERKVPRLAASRDMKGVILHDVQLSSRCGKHVVAEGVVHLEKRNIGCLLQLGCSSDCCVIWENEGVLGALRDLQIASDKILWVRVSGDLFDNSFAFSACEVVGYDILSKDAVAKLREDNPPAEGDKVRSSNCCDTRSGRKRHWLVGNLRLFQDTSLVARSN